MSLSLFQDFRFFAGEAAVRGSLTNYACPWSGATRPHCTHRRTLVVRSSRRLTSPLRRLAPPSPARCIGIDREQRRDAGLKSAQASPGLSGKRSSSTDAVCGSCGAPADVRRPVETGLASPVPAFSSAVHRSLASATSPVAPSCWPVDAPCLLHDEPSSSRSEQRDSC